MTRSIPKQAVVLVMLACAALGAMGAPARACIILNGGSTKVSGEEVLIVWDAAHHTEHFVRHMQFADAAADFGFMVPTPTRPTLGEADDAVFGRLFDIYRRPPPRAIPQSAHGADGLVAAAAVAPVTVVEQRRVAGLDATVLSATDAAALSAWLGAHHYASTPSMTAYLAPYVRQHYFVTAFRYTGARAGEHLGTRAVRMSFTTDRPFFPYAEPTDAPHVPERLFRVSVVSSERVSGLVGAAAWGARTAYANRPPSLPATLHGAVPASAMPTNAWLTTFQEDSSTRGRDDLFFVRAAQQTNVAGSLEHAVE